MSNYIHVASLTVKGIGAIRAENPRMSIPDGADLSDIGYAALHPAVSMPPAEQGQRLVAGTPVLVEGKWRETYTVETLPVRVPQQITRAQGKAALIVQGLWPGVLAYVAAIPDPVQKALAEVALHDTLNWERSSPFLNTAATGLGMTGADLDNLFIAASGIAL